jgi:hypothetical protein
MMRNFDPFILRLLLFVFQFIPLTLTSTLFAQPVAEQVCSLTAYDPGGHAIWLNTLPGDPSRFYLFDSLGGTLTIFSDSTATVTGRIYNRLDTTRQWDMILSLRYWQDYAAWTGQGRMLKNGGGASLADQQNWTFFELDSAQSFFTGVPGTHFDGDTLQVYHYPVDYSMGFQLGVGANDKNGNYGMSGWFGYEGSYSGKGDINVNASCDTINNPPPPTCSVEIDTFYAQCKTDSSFEMVISFSGVGSSFQISDDQGTAIMGNLTPGTYVFGDYFNSTDVVLIVSDSGFVACADTTLPTTADCTPVPVCDLTLDTVYTECLNDTFFTVWVGFSGSGNHYAITDDKNTPKLGGLSAGLYAYGTYPQDSLVKIFVSDSLLFTCVRASAPITDSCSLGSGGNMLAELRADPVAGEVHLSWFTLTEFNNLGFEIQRSTDGEKWQAVGWKAGMMTYDQPTKYRFVDRQIANATRLFYRLKQVNQENKTRYSPTLRVNLQDLQPISVGKIYPNPVTDNIFVNIVAEKSDLPFTITVIDNVGKITKQISPTLYQGYQDVSLSLSNLQPGLYYIKFEVDGIIISTQHMLILERD